MNLIASSKLIVIVGLGVTGLSVARFLKRHKQPFVAMDSRAEPPGIVEFKQEHPDVAIHLGDLNESLLTQASEIILSPGVSLQTPAIAAAKTAGVSIVGDVELFAREVDKPVIAITGSNAKSTVTSMLGKMATDSGINVGVGGNIGEPVLDLLSEEIELYVLEISSFQLETTQSLKPKVATILNISPDHMDRYASLVDYHRAKQRIYFGAETVVVNRADPLTQPPLAEGVTCLSFGLDVPDRGGFGIRISNGKSVLVHEFNDLLSVDQLKVRGHHNVANCLAALALGFAAGFDMQAMLDSLQTFPGLTHRCQWVATINKVEFINDSKATNVGATLAALSGFSGQGKNIILIAGGDAKGADFYPLKAGIISSVCLLILMGRDAAKIAAIAETIVPINYAASMQEAVTIAKDKAVAGNIVLLSPACASLDMFSNYQERGEEFMAAVNREVA